MEKLDGSFCSEYKTALKQVAATAFIGKTTVTLERIIGAPR